MIFYPHVLSELPLFLINTFLINASFHGNPISWSFGFLHKIILYSPIVFVTRLATENS